MKWSKVKERPRRYECSRNSMCRTKKEKPDPMVHNEEHYRHKGVCLWLVSQTRFRLHRNLVSFWRSQCSLILRSIFASENENHHTHIQWVGWPSADTNPASLRCALELGYSSNPN